MPSRLGPLSEKILQLRVTDPIKEVPVKYISEIIDARSREIIEAVLYYIQESGLQNDIRSGVVLTGGGARLTNLANLFKEMSGYEVRAGYPQHRFSTQVSNVYELGSTAAIGMVLAAKEDNLPDCATRPAITEPEEKEELIVEKVEIAEEESGSGLLFDNVDIVPQKETKKTKGPRTGLKVTTNKKKKEGEASGTIFWERLEKWYNKMTEE